MHAQPACVAAERHSPTVRNDIADARQCLALGALDTPDVLVSAMHCKYCESALLSMDLLPRAIFASGDNAASMPAHLCCRTRDAFFSSLKLSTFPLDSAITNVATILQTIPCDGGSQFVSTLLCFVYGLA